MCLRLKELTNTRGSVVLPGFDGEIGAAPLGLVHGFTQEDFKT
jgi:hypothetical protein